VSSIGRSDSSPRERPAFIADEEFVFIAPITVERTSYQHGQIIPRHQNSQARFLRSLSGMVSVSTSQGIWTIPAGHGLLIPAGEEHYFRMMGNVLLQILSIEARAANRFGTSCFTVAVTPLLHNLIEDAMNDSNDSEHYSRRRAIDELLLIEIQHRPRLPLWLPLPSERALSERCANFLLQPKIEDTIELWSSRLNMSRRTFTRTFRRETGLSFVNWRQRACVFAALSRLAQGETVSEVARALGFERSTSFTVMFRRWLGASPKNYRPTNEGKD